MEFYMKINSKKTMTAFLALFLAVSQVGWAKCCKEKGKEIGEKIDHAADKTKEIASDLKDKAKDAADAVKNKSKEIAEDTKEKAKELHEASKDKAHELIDKA